MQYIYFLDYCNVLHAIHLRTLNIKMSTNFRPDALLVDILMHHLTCLVFSLTEE